MGVCSLFWGREGACARKRLLGVGRVAFSLGVKGCAARFRTAPRAGLFISLWNETALAKLFFFYGGCTFISIPF